VMTPQGPVQGVVTEAGFANFKGLRRPAHWRFTLARTGSCPALDRDARRD